MVTPPPFSLHFAYYGADAVPSAEDTIHSFAGGSVTTDAAIERMIGPVERTDLMGATVKGIGGYLRLVYKAEELPPTPERISDLIRRAA